MTTNTADPRPPASRQYRYYDLVMAAFVTVLLCANLIGASKQATLFGFRFGAGVLFFPISYIFGDVLTEVYGYARARRVIWAGFMAMIFASVMAWVVVHLPASPTESFNTTLQLAIEVVFGYTWRIALASIAAFWAGDFVNAYVLARMKVWTGGRWLWTRTIGSTIETCDERSTSSKSRSASRSTPWSSTSAAATATTPSSWPRAATPWSVSTTRPGSSRRPIARPRRDRRRKPA